MRLRLLKMVWAKVMDEYYTNITHNPQNVQKSNKIEDEEFVIPKGGSKEDDALFIRGFFTTSEPLKHAIYIKPTGADDPWEKYRELNDQLDNLRIQGEVADRQYGQKVFHQAIAVALLPIIYGIQWNSFKKRVFKKLGLDEIIRTIFIISSRQVGKSSAIAMIAAAALAHVPNIRIAIFAQRESTAQNMGQMIKDFFKDIDGLSYVMEGNNQLKITLRFSSRDVRTCTVFPMTDVSAHFINNKENGHRF